ncbi:MAG: ImmA/IrrE family metallo-endopeptidase [Caulobacteraceae bacterium]
MVDSATAKLRSNLKKAGLSEGAIDAAWPSWWSDEASTSSSARAELRFAVARKLGISPKALSEDRVEFVWVDTARFKHLSNEGQAQKAALASFGVSVGRLVLHASRTEENREVPSAKELRAALLDHAPFIQLNGLLGACWALGIPVIHLRVFPLAAKSMHAMVVRVGERFAVLLGKDAQYPAPVAFTLAHELGHVALRHVKDAGAIVDLEDPVEGDGGDAEEQEADQYALSLLTGSPTPDIRTNIDRFGARQLAQAVLDRAHAVHIEPGTLALCYAYRSNNWSRAIASLRYIYDAPKPVWREINGLAAEQIDWTLLPEDSSDFLRNVMGLANG